MTKRIEPLFAVRCLYNGHIAAGYINQHVVRLIVVEYSKIFCYGLIKCEGHKKRWSYFPLFLEPPALKPLAATTEAAHVPVIGNVLKGRVV